MLSIPKDSRVVQFSMIAIVALASFGVIVSPVAATTAPTAGQIDQQVSTTPSVVVHVDEDGSATVEVTNVIDLEDPEEREAFESLREDESTRTAATERFEERMRTIADDAADRADRPMTVADPTLELETADEGRLGVVRLRISWSGLAAVDGDRLLVTEPFASGYVPDRTFVITGPEGYQIVAVSPEPDERDETTARWTADAELDGFTMIFDRTVAGDGADGNTNGVDGSTDPTESLPGFGLPIATIAVAIAVLTTLYLSRRPGQ
jgi:hypothetical protein